MCWLDMSLIISWASGTPTEAGLYADIEAVYDYLVNTNMIKDAGKELVVYGQSGMSA